LKLLLSVAQAVDTWNPTEEKSKGKQQTGRALDGTSYERPPSFERQVGLVVRKLKDKRANRRNAPRLPFCLY
jgi:hypothetical protein